MGIALLPCYAGDMDERLIRVSDPIRNLDMELWVLTHPDLRNSAKIRALMSFLYNDLGMRADLWSGERKTTSRWNFIERDGT
jgi:DNA-binding transcriptional LysR family regulator